MVSKRQLVYNIRHDLICITPEQFIATYHDDATANSLPDLWITEIVRTRRGLPVFDATFDVVGRGTVIAQRLGANVNIINNTLCPAWDLLAEDVQAAWIEGFKAVDEYDYADPNDYKKQTIPDADFAEIGSYSQLLLDLLNPP